MQVFEGLKFQGLACRVLSRMGEWCRLWVGPSFPQINHYGKRYRWKWARVEPPKTQGTKKRSLLPVLRMRLNTEVFKFS